MSLLTYLLMAIMSYYVSHCVHGCVESYRVLDFLVVLECQEENRPFSGQQHQAQFVLDPALPLGELTVIPRL